jgi:hypothetical protein
MLRDRLRKRGTGVKPVPACSLKVADGARVASRCDKSQSRTIEERNKSKSERERRRKERSNDTNKTGSADFRSHEPMWPTRDGVKELSLGASPGNDLCHLECEQGPDGQKNCVSSAPWGVNTRMSAYQSSGLRSSRDPTACWLRNSAEPLGRGTAWVRNSRQASGVSWLTNCSHINAGTERRRELETANS